VGGLPRGGLAGGSAPATQRCFTLPQQPLPGVSRARSRGPRPGHAPRGPPPGAHRGALACGGRRHGTRLAGAIEPHSAPRRPVAHQAHRRARGAHQAGPSRGRLGGCPPAGPLPSVGPTASLCQACASGAVGLPRARGLGSHREGRGATARPSRAPPPRTGCARGSRRGVAPGGASRAQGPGQNARGSVPTLQLAGGRTPRLPLPEAAATPLARSAPKAGLADRAAQRLPHVGRRHDGSAGLRAEAAGDVCGDPGIRRATAGAPQPTATCGG
jgi:hypothetical protein